MHKSLIAFIIAGAVLFALPTYYETDTETEAPARTVLQSELKDYDIPAADIAPQPNYLGDFLCTAYCPCSICCGEYADGTTATGTRATAGRTIATDPAEIPAGSHVAVYYEDGAYAEYIAEDTGSGVHGQHIDVYYNTHQEALQHGVRAAQVYLLEE